MLTLINKLRNKLEKSSPFLFLLFRKIYVFLKLNAPPKIKEFPNNKINTIGYKNPLTFKNCENFYFTRFFNEHLKNCDEINNSLLFGDKKLFKKGNISLIR